jgi:hypothetical protein
MTLYVLLCACFTCSLYLLFTLFSVQIDSFLGLGLSCKLNSFLVEFCLGGGMWRDRGFVPPAILFSPSFYFLCYLVWGIESLLPPLLCCILAVCYSSMSEFFKFFWHCYYLFLAFVRVPILGLLFPDWFRLFNMLLPRDLSSLLHLPRHLYFAHVLFLLSFK